MKRERALLSKPLVEVTLLDDSLVLFVGRASILLDRAEAEEVIRAVSRALSRMPTVSSEPKEVKQAN